MIARALAALLALSAPALAFDPTRWIKADEFYTLANGGHSRGDLFMNNYTGASNPSGCVVGQWCTVDVSSMGVAPDAKAVFLSGILIITHGTLQEIADMQVSFRSYGQTSACPVPQVATCVDYAAQVTEAHIGGGQRSGVALWVPVAAGKFQFRWNLSTPGSWPDHASYGLNMTAQAWVR